MDCETFSTLPTAEVARLMRQTGPKVCVFPINGTRRWFMLEHMTEQEVEPVTRYLDVSGRSHVALYRLLFDHGLDTLLTPIFGPDLVGRGDAYLRLAVEGLARLATHPDFCRFYDEYRVRVRFYGDHRRFFCSTPYAYLSDLFEATMSRTSDYDRYRLFFGVCAQDATESAAKLAIDYYLQYGYMPDKQNLVAMYYGEPVGPVSLFIGFDKFCVFDMPLLATGEEDLYFTVNPSLYLTERQLRDILYDHLYTRRGSEPDYEELAPEEWAWMRQFYAANTGRTLGIGRLAPGGFWYPLPEVILPG